MHIVGREQELDSLRAFIGDGQEGPAALVLEGEAGIGKSTLWLAGVGLARAAGSRVLQSRPAEAERGLAHVGLTDLLEDVLDEVVPALSAPRRRALEVAFAVRASDTDADPRALGIATRDALETLASAGGRARRGSPGRNAAWRNSSRRAGRTARWPPRCSSASAPWPVT